MLNLVGGGRGWTGDGWRVFGFLGGWVRKGVEVREGDVGGLVGCRE